MIAGSLGAGLLLALSGAFVGGGDNLVFVVAVLAVAFVALSLAWAKATCTSSGVIYVNGRRRSIAAADVTEIAVELGGTQGVCPTIVIYRRSGRPVALCGVQGWDSKSGWQRQEMLADEWRGILGIEPGLGSPGRSGH